MRRQRGGAGDGGWAAARRLPLACRRAARTIPLAGVLLAGLVAGCDGLPSIVDRARAGSAHVRYAEALVDAGLDESALGAGWLAAAGGALSGALRVSLPHRETGYFASTEAPAAGWRFALRRGERLVVVARSLPAAAADSARATGRAPTPDAAGEAGIGAGLAERLDSARAPRPSQLFADLFEVVDDTANPFELRASAEDGADSLIYEARRDADFVLRLQPELLRSVQFDLVLRAGPSLAFPVDGHDSRAVQSVFGVARDGGRREHHGIDIFAPRGTPVLAAIDGTVRSTRPNELGGRVVWLRDPVRNQSLYYAHLDSVVVAAGTPVTVGDTVGFVGNTGNARTTRPHLHFGIYARGAGPVDPLPFVRRPRATPERPADAVAALGALARTSRGPSALRREATTSGDTIAMVVADTPLRLDGVTANWLRVRLPDGRGGWLPRRNVERLAPLRRVAFPHAVAIHDRADAGAPALAFTNDTRIPVLGAFAEFVLVELADGRRGWVAIGAEAGSRD